MSTAAALPRLAITTGEPAGIGPELVARLAAGDTPADLVALTDPDLLRDAAGRCGIDLDIAPYRSSEAVTRRRPGQIRVEPVPLKAEVHPGRLDARNAFHVLSMLSRAADGCLTGEFSAVITAPVQKSVINDAGEVFSGHTEFFAQRAGVDVVMMLASPHLRVALVTTHMPLSAVPAAITRERLRRTLRTVHTELRERFGIPAPRLAVLGLNPHAGESGHMGREEIDTLIPELDALRAEGMALLGPLPADTAFVPAQREHYDAVVAMYHDQALPVLKSEAFDSAVNVTLGLPFIRTSVDHGTALDLAGRGRADPSSLLAATHLALQMARQEHA